MAAFMAIAHDLNAPPPDVRDAAPEGLRSNLSSSFATALQKGLERQIESRLGCADELASALHDCLVERGEELYTVFISYRVLSERFHAALLYDLLNNTITPAGHRVIVFLDSRRLVKGAAWEDGFIQGLLHSMVAVPLVSRGFLAPLMSLAGLETDRRDNVALELMLMQALAEISDTAPSQDASKGQPQTGLEAIYPIFIGDPCPPEKGFSDSTDKSSTTQPEASLSRGSSSRRGSRSGGFSYPRSSNFFNDCARLIADLPDVVSPPTAAAAVHALFSCGILSADSPSVRTVRATVQEVLTRQGAELWASGANEPEDIPPDSDVLLRATTEPTEPALDSVQLGMVKAQLRTLIPAIHAVVDRAQSRAAGRRRARASSCANDVMAGGVVEGREPPSPSLKVEESAAGQLPRICSDAAGSAQPAAGVVGRYVGPGKVEAVAEPAQREEGSPADGRKGLHMAAAFAPVTGADNQPYKAFA